MRFSSFSLSKVFAGLIFSLLLLLKQPAASAETLTLLADEWFPINANSKSELQGFGIDFLKEIFKKKNIVIDYKITPWERSLAEVEKGKADCVIGAYKEDAPGFIFPEEPIIRDQQGVFSLKSVPVEYKNLDSLLTLQVGLVSSYSYGQEIDDFLVLHKGAGFAQYAVGDKPLQTNIKKLIAGRINAIIESKIVMNATLAQLKLDDKVEMLSSMGGITDIYIACSPVRETSKKYVQIWDEGMRALKASGEMKTILARYGLK